MLAVGVPTGVAGPASAEPGWGSLSAGNGVIYAQGCLEHPVPYNLTLPAGTTNWSLEIDTIAPDGTVGPARRVSSPAWCQALAPSDFTMRAAKSQTKLRAKTKRPRLGKAVEFSTKSRQEEQTGYFGTDAEVVLQTKRKGKWVTLGRTRIRTDSAGKAKVTKGRKSVKVRAVTVRSNDYDKSA